MKGRDLTAARPLRLFWQSNQRDGMTHWEWTAPCGCAYHPEPEPHVHACSEHRKAGEAHLYDGPDREGDPQ